jgi:hypothetical protein
VDYLRESAASVYRLRRRRRAVITLTFVSLLLIGTLGYAASYVQGWVGKEAPRTVANAGCNAVSNQRITPGGVTINVYNSTSRPGLASTAARTLEGRGFRVAAVDNDPLGRTILGLGEIRHGRGGTAEALLAAASLPGVRLVQDDRMDASVDLVLGNKFRALSVPHKAAISKAKRAPRC